MNLELVIKLQVGNLGTIPGLVKSVWKTPHYTTESQHVL